MTFRFKKSRAGYTLMEMLIVVAIIAILVALMIPVLGGVLEKSREATDVANIRGAYATISVEALCDDITDGVIIIPLKQTKDDWQNEDLMHALEALGTVEGSPVKDGTCEVSWLEDTSAVLFLFEGSRISFPQHSNIGDFAKSYSKLVSKYLQSNANDLGDYASRRWQDCNGHKVVTVSTTHSEYKKRVADQATADKYPDDVISELNTEPGNHQYTVSYLPNPISYAGQYTAYLEYNESENQFQLLAYQYIEYEGAKRLFHLCTPDGSDIVTPYVSMGDTETKEHIANYYWP